MLSLWWNVRVQRVIWQAVFAAIVIGVGYLLITNIQNELDRLGLDLFPFAKVKSDFPFVHLSWGFLDQRAGFDIAETSFGRDYSANDSYRDAYITGVLNTINVSIIGIFLATVIGLVVGVSRLSKNWLVSHVALVYVETFRNVPLLVQLIFWYVAIYLKLPRISDAIDLDFAIISNRAVALPSLNTESGFGAWTILLAIALAAAAGTWVMRARREELTGDPKYPWWSAFAVFGAVGAIGFLVTGVPLSIETPGIEERAVVGGAQMTPEYAALLTGLSLYTAAFIAENVRGSILAIPRGQTEAAAALGLSGFQRMRYVILPQTLRILIPPTTNQYLNLTKNSSLAFAVAFKDVFAIGRIINNQSGQTFPIVALLMVTYLSFSLIISLVMNTIHGRLKWGEARR